MRRIAGVVFGWLFLPLCAFAQIGTDMASITGKVADASTGVPLTGANVLVTGTGHGAATDADGTYHIVNVPAGSHTVSAQFIGYRSSAQDVTLQAGEALELDFALSVSALALDEVVVTGTGQGTTKRTLGTSISIIYAEEVENLAIQSVGEMLGGRTPGVLAVSTTGTAGGPIRIRVRGMNSLSVSNEPIIYIDGIQIDNASREPFFNYLGGQEQSRLGDISPDDIDHIEIVKGSAAATLYGTTAANGVIQIFTKRGRLNSKPRWTLETEQGFSSYSPDMFTYDEENFSYVAPVALGLEDTIEVESFGGKLMRQTMIGNGVIESYHLSVQGGGDAITYYLAGRSSREVGAFMPGSNKNQLYSAKANVSIQASDKLSLTAVNYISFRRQFEVTNDNHVFGYMAQALLSKGDTTALLPNGEAFFALDRIDKIENRHETFRYTGSISLNYRPQRNWNNRILLGLDLTADELANVVPYQESVQFVPLGERNIDGRRFWSLTLDASSGHKAQLGRIGFATSVGAQGFMEETKLIAASGEEFPFIGLSTIGATAIRDAWGTRFRSINAGIYIQEVVDVNNALFLTAAYRVDGNSAFGDEFVSQRYPKLALSYLLENLNIPLLGRINLKLRGANGKSGNQPATFAKDRTFDPTSLAGAAGLTSGNFGDKELEPETSTETEVGLDLSFLDERWGLEFTSYSQKTLNALIFKQIAPSTGFRGVQQFNLGEVSNRGRELFLRGLIINTRGLKWNLSFSYSQNDNKIISVGDAAVPVGNFAGVNRNEEGYPVASLWARGIRADTVSIVSGSVEAVEVPELDYYLNDDNPEEPSYLVVDPIWKDIRIMDNKRVVHAGKVFVGPTLPPRTGYLRNDVTLFGKVNLSFLIDWADGNWVLDFTRVFQLDFENLKRPELTAYEVQYYTNKMASEGFKNLSQEEKDRLLGLARLDPLALYNMMSPGGYVKLREVSASYTLHNVLGLESLTFVASGRNLWTKSPYSGPDPEVNWSGASSTQLNGVDFLTTPSARRFTFTVRARF